MTPLFALLDGDLDARTLLAHLGYLASVVMFMLALIRMSRVKTAGGANTLAASAMALAVVSQLVELGSFDPTWLAAGFAAGGLVGALLASRVSMTGMPELVALLNGFGGFASTLVGVGTWFHWTERHAAGGGPLADAFTGVNLMLTIVLGNLTFTGSLVAYLKLSEKMPTRPLLLPARNLVNLLLFLVSIGLTVAAAVAFTNGDPAAGLVWTVTAVTLVLGATLVLPIGGGDMPVVISLHDSFAGFAGALAGFAIGSPVLIVAGTIVGAAGMILTRIMCKSMNRGMWNVVLGGFGATADAGSAGGGGYGTVRSADAEEAAMVLADARTCIIVPGYGMAVAQAQHAVRELADLLEKRGCTVRYAVHPVAGRMPGHMNVLLAEANVPYDKLYEMDAIDSDFKNTDVAIVIGANDVVNPAAKTNKQSPLYGMPVLSVDEAKTVFVIKRSLGAGFAGVKNELFERENTRMIYADGKKAVEDISKALKEA